MSAVSYAVGQCTYYVGSVLPWVQPGWGNASDWLTNAQKAGLRTGSAPAVGSILVYKPGNETSSDPASSQGHVAVVEGIQKNGLPIVSEMNWNGGVGVRDVRALQNWNGVAGFIYPPGSAAGSIGSGLQYASDLTSPSTAGGPASVAGGCRSLGDSVSGGLPVLSGVSGFFSWIAQPCVYHRLLIQAACVGLIVYGLKLVGQPGPAHIVTAPVRAVRSAV